MSKSSKLSKVSASLGHEPQGDAKPPALEANAKAFVVYDATVDPAGEFEHEGRAMIWAGGEFLMFSPGLNILDAAGYAKGQEHVLIKARVDAGSLKTTDAQLSGYTSLSKRRELAAKTQQPEALEALLAFERGLEVSAGRAKRRDAKIVELLKHRLASAARAPVIDVSDLHTMARSQAQVAQAG